MLLMLVVNIFLLLGALSSSSETFLAGQSERKTEIESNEHPTSTYGSAYFRGDQQIYDVNEGHEQSNEICPEAQIIEAMLEFHTASQNALKNLAHQLEMLKVAVENLEPKFNSQILKLEHEMSTHKTSLLNEFKEMIQEKHNIDQPKSCHPHIDVRDNSNNIYGWKNLEHQLEMLKVSVENSELNFKSLTLKLEDELVTHKTELLHDFKQLIQELHEKQHMDQPNSCHSRMDVSDNFTNTSAHNISEHKEQSTLNITELKKQSPPTMVPTSCAEALQDGASSGIYQIHLPNSGLKPFPVYCLNDPENGAAWTVVQRRQDGSIDFRRDWCDYKEGFGNLNGEFFIGLDKLHALTQSNVQELWIELESFDNEHRHARYDAFAIGGEEVQYAMNVLGEFSGDAGDSMRSHQGKKFFHLRMKLKKCGILHSNAWWSEWKVLDKLKMHKNPKSNLNGKYLQGIPLLCDFGIIWQSWHGYTCSLKKVHMAIRPVRK